VIKIKSSSTYEETKKNDQLLKILRGTYLGEAESMTIFEKRSGRLIEAIAPIMPETE
jgi:hypothetical protein